MIPTVPGVPKDNGSDIKRSTGKNAAKKNPKQTKNSRLYKINNLTINQWQQQNHNNNDKLNINK